MICADEAQGDVAGVLAARAKVSKPTWRDRTYSCTYRYPSGSFDISVVEYPTIPAATTGYATLAADPKVSDPDLGMADASFARADGSLVLRQDRRIVEVDPTHLPARFSKLELAPAAVARAVAVTVLRCWQG
jgi:hypothetical protein